MQVAGVRFQFDPAKLAGTRIGKNIKLGGQQLVLTRNYTVAMRATESVIVHATAFCVCEHRAARSFSTRGLKCQMRRSAKARRVDIETGPSVAQLFRNHLRMLCKSLPPTHDGAVLTPPFTLTPRQQCSTDFEATPTPWRAQQPERCSRARCGCVSGLHWTPKLMGE